MKIHKFNPIMKKNIQINHQNILIIQEMTPQEDTKGNMIKNMQIFFHQQK